jgi:predicted transcriptional regulator
MTDNLLEHFPFANQTREQQLSKLSKILSERPGNSQREAANKAGVSRGSVKKFDDAYQSLSEIEKAQLAQTLRSHQITRIVAESRGEEAEPA